MIRILVLETALSGQLALDKAFVEERHVNALSLCTPCGPAKVRRGHVSALVAEAASLVRVDRSGH